MKDLTSLSALRRRENLIEIRVNVHDLSPELSKRYLVTSFSAEFVVAAIAFDLTNIKDFKMLESKFVLDDLRRRRLCIIIRGVIADDHGDCW